MCQEKMGQAIAADVAKAKGSTECATTNVELLGAFGYADIAILFDNEFAIEALCHEVAANRTRPTRFGSPVPMHPQTHGQAEWAVQGVIGQIRGSRWVVRRR